MAEFKDITYDQVFEDKNRGVNSVSETAPQPWMIEFDGLLEHEAEIWRSHYALAVHDKNDFPYTELNGTVNAGVKYRKFECKSDETGGWWKITIELVKYPS